MKILIVGQYYYPDDFRINDISYLLVSMGHDVTVLTGLPDYTNGKIPKEYRWFKKRKETYRGVKIIRVPVIARRKGVFLRIINYVSFLVSSTIKAMFMSRDFDVIFCYQTSPITMANAAVKMKKRTGKKLFLYCLDLWPESLKAWNIRENSPLFKMILKYSRHIYQCCDLIGISSLPFKEYLENANNVDGQKIVYLPQHADTIGAEAVGINEGSNKSKVINFAFAGNIGRLQDVECIIRAANRLKDHKGFAVHIFGSGSMLDSCRELACELGIEDRLTFYGRINRMQLIEEYKHMDAFLLTLKKEGFIGLTMPAKLQEYMSMGKPIFAAIDGAASQVIDEANCGLVAPPSDDVKLAENMKRFIESPEEFVHYGNNAIKYFNENYTREVFMSRLDGILKSFYYIEKI
jgi:glycosyltransferase involved in cell wall biosynthesis